MYTGIGAFIQVVEFETEANRQQALIDVLVAEVERWIRYRPGFVQSTFHASLDGCRVVINARWSSQSALQSFQLDPEFERLTAAIRVAHPKGKPQTRSYRVVESIGAPFVD